LGVGAQVGTEKVSRLLDVALKNVSVGAMARRAVYGGALVTIKGKFDGQQRRVG
jgi:hypothetical protein